MIEEEMKIEEWYVILNMNCKYEICRMCPKSGLFKGSYEECEKWIEQKQKEEATLDLYGSADDVYGRDDYQQGFKDGVEFAYNKANEWHYNGVPENDNDILCQIDKDIFVVGYFHQKYKQYYTTSGEWLETVIAWKEIVLPELKESE